MQMKDRRGRFSSLPAALFASLAIAGLIASLSATALASPGTPAQRAPKRHKAKSKGKSVKIKGGTIAFTLLPPIASSFESAALNFAPVGPASGSATSVSMPITAGKLNTATGAGAVTAAAGAPSANGFKLTQTTKGINFGVLELGGGTQEFTLSAPVTVTIGGTPKFGPGSGSNLTANVNGSTTPSGPFFTLKAGKPALQGTTITIANLPASLTEPAANVLGSFSGVTFKPGEELGKITVQASK